MSVPHQPFGYGEFSPVENDAEDPNTTTVVLTIAARGLRDTDLDSVSDPFCVVSNTQAGMVRTRKWTEAGRTEVINNCLDPEWSTKIHLQYNFEEQQRLLFEVFDKGPQGKNTRLGQTSLLLHEIIGAKYNRVTTPLRGAIVGEEAQPVEDGKQYGQITVTAEELSKGRQESVYFMVSASKLDRKDFLGKCDPFLKISRINYDNTLQLAYRSRYRGQNLNPKWKPFEIHVNQLCYGDKSREFLIECYDWDQDGNHDLVGTCSTTVDRLINGYDRELPLINEKKARKSKKYIDSGMLHFHKVYCWMDYTFLDFVTGGTELDFTVAIDFTTANTESESNPHATNASGNNQYELAIQSIGEICQYYSRSKVFHAYGFGARLPPTNKIHYNFPLDLISGDARCEGINGLLRAYQIAQDSVGIAGQADFAPTIRFAARKAASLPPDGSKYQVLLIITDGVIHDMARTKEEIVKASSLPLSIIIVGVGYDSFEEMKVLDSDDALLCSNGKYAKRDIVQFVQLRNFLPPHRRLADEEIYDAKRMLAKQVLEEIPMQLTSYMKSKGIFPRPPSSPFREASVRGRPATADMRCGIQQTQSPRAPSLSGRPRRMLPQIPTAETRSMQIS